MSVFEYRKDGSGIVTVTMNMSGPVNAMNQEYRTTMGETLDRLEAEEGLAGVVIASAKKVFFAGGDLEELLAVERGQEKAAMALSDLLKAQLRRLERLPVPVVAAINGAALGGGYEICLACNYRIAADIRSVQIGVPEVGLGLLPGGGGIVRLVNLLGLEKALPFLLEGTKVDAGRALADGLIHETVASTDQLIPRAKAWILENSGNESAVIQPWDFKGFSIPGGGVDSPKLAQMIAMAPAMLWSKTRGLQPAPEQILDCAVEAARLDFATAERVESRGLAYLVTTPEAKNMISTFFFGMNRLNSGASRPAQVPRGRVSRIAVLGAGAKGRGIAHAAAMAGIEVIIKAATIEAAESGRAYSERLLTKQVERGRIDAATLDSIVRRIQPAVNDDDLRACDIVIEAADDDAERAQLSTDALKGSLDPGVLWAISVSDHPTSTLAKATMGPDQCVGLHFFSPVEKTPLVEIVRGEQTDNEALARAFDFVQQLGKTPIVVNDAPGFYITRTIACYLDEGVRLLAEGMHPARIENLGRAIGMPAGPLLLLDQIGLEPTRDALASWDSSGLRDRLGERDAMRAVVEHMLGQGRRGGSASAGGFYEYAEGGQRSLWLPLLDSYYQPREAFNDEETKDRLLFRQVIESLKCLQEGVLHSALDGNVASLMGIGAPAASGGYLQFVNSYGLKRFDARGEHLQGTFGERFGCPEIVTAAIAGGADKIA